MTLNPKEAVKNWLSEQWEKRVKDPIARKTEELENQASQKINEYIQKAQVQANKPLDYYKKQEAFYRGLFWIGVLLLLILWILSGS